MATAAAAAPTSKFSVAVQKTVCSSVVASTVGAGIGALAVSTLAATAIGGAAGAIGILACIGTNTLINPLMTRVDRSNLPPDDKTALNVAQFVLSLLIGAGVAVGVILLLATALATPAGMAIVAAAWILALLYLGYSAYQQHKAS